MSSSTGIISPVISGAPNSFMEGQRQAAALPEMSSTYTRLLEGYIKEVHEDNLLVKVYTLRGTSVAGDSWLSLSHSPEEIVERFGTVRKGMRVQVSYTGPDAGEASVRIIGNEGNKGSDEKFADNTLKRNIFAIFTPGV